MQDNELEISEQIKSAIADNKTLRIVGGGTRQQLGNACKANQVLSTQKLNGISLYEPGALTLVAAAGTPLKNIERTLAKQGQRLPFEPMDHRKLLGSKGEPTIGGIVACNISGPARIQAGACRDSLIGVRFVDGTGNIVKNGGRVMKNVTGYDLVKLMCGSYGSLGVLTEVAFKVLPAPEATATIIIPNLSDTTAIDTLSAALGSPYEVNGAACVPSNHDQPSETMIRIEGFKNSVDYRINALSDFLKLTGNQSVITDKRANLKLWDQIKNIHLFQGIQGDVWRFSIRPSDGPKLVDNLQKISNETQVLYDWGGGLVWALMPTSINVRSALNGLTGHGVCVRAAHSPKWEKRAPENAIIAKIETGLRDRFDPHGILNPGIMG